VEQVPGDFAQGGQLHGQPDQPGERPYRVSILRCYTYPRGSPNMGAPLWPLLYNYECIVIKMGAPQALYNCIATSMGAPIYYSGG
jgi:hypothetical protein